MSLELQTLKLTPLKAQTGQVQCPLMSTLLPLLRELM